MCECGSRMSSRFSDLCWRGKSLLNHVVLFCLCQITFDVCVVEVTSQAIVQRPHVSFISGANSFLIVVSQSRVG